MSDRAKTTVTAGCYTILTLEAGGSGTLCLRKSLINYRVGEECQDIGRDSCNSITDKSGEKDCF